MSINIVSINMARPARTWFGEIGYTEHKHEYARPNQL